MDDKIEYLVFRGAGNLAYFHAGVWRQIKESGLYSRFVGCKLGGISSGALMALLIACGIELETAIADFHVGINNYKKDLEVIQTNKLIHQNINIIDMDQMPNFGNHLYKLIALKNATPMTQKISTEIETETTTTTTTTESKTTKAGLGAGVGVGATAVCLASGSMFVESYAQITKTIHHRTHSRVSVLPDRLSLSIHPMQELLSRLLPNMFPGGFLSIGRECRIRYVVTAHLLRLYLREHHFRRILDGAQVVSISVFSFETNSVISNTRWHSIDHIVEWLLAAMSIPMITSFPRQVTTYEGKTHLAMDAFNFDRIPIKLIINLLRFVIYCLNLALFFNQVWKTQQKNLKLYFPKNKYWDVYSGILASSLHFFLEFPSIFPLLRLPQFYQSALLYICNPTELQRHRQHKLSMSMRLSHNPDQAAETKCPNQATENKCPHHVTIICPAGCSLVMHAPIKSDALYYTTKYVQSSLWKRLFSYLSDSISMLAFRLIFPINLLQPQLQQARMPLFCINYTKGYNSPTNKITSAGALSGTHNDVNKCMINHVCSMYKSFPKTVHISPLEKRHPRYSLKNKLRKWSIALQNHCPWYDLTTNQCLNDEIDDYDTSSEITPDMVFPYQDIFLEHDLERQKYIYTAGRLALISYQKSLSK